MFIVSYNSSAHLTKKVLTLHSQIEHGSSYSVTSIHVF